MGVRPPDVQFDGVRIQRYAFIEDGQSFIVAAFVVEVMGLFVEIVGAEECVRHRQDLPRQVEHKLRISIRRSKRIPHAPPSGGTATQFVTAVTAGFLDWSDLRVDTAGISWSDR
jgi:aspartate/tyrosine/aromatic aminotransferase